MLYYSVLTCSSLETHCMYNQIHYANPDCARNSWQQKLNCCISSESHSDSSTLPSSLCTYQTSHTLWSSGEQLLKILKFLGECSFTFIAPSVWSLVPASVWDLHTEFKTQLKTFLFRQAFSQTYICPPFLWFLRLYVCMCRNQSSQLIWAGHDKALKGENLE